MASWAALVGSLPPCLHSIPTRCPFEPNDIHDDLFKAQLFSFSLWHQGHTGDPLAPLSLSLCLHHELMATCVGASKLCLRLFMSAFNAWAPTGGGTHAFSDVYFSSSLLIDGDNVIVQICHNYTLCAENHVMDLYSFLESNWRGCEPVIKELHARDCNAMSPYS